MDFVKIDLEQTLKLGDTVDITDPCYDEDVWCRKTVSCVPGNYIASVVRWVDDTAYIEGEKVVYPDNYSDSRIAEIQIVHEDYSDINMDDAEEIGFIGVDAGLAGFFDNKMDFSDEEWDNFCNVLRKEDTEKENSIYEYIYFMYNGFFSSSGFGDGRYSVYGVAKDGKYVGLKIVFIDEGFFDEDYDC